MTEPREDLINRAKDIYKHAIIEHEPYYYSKTKLDTKDKFIEILSEYLTQDELNSIIEGGE